MASSPHEYTLSTLQELSSPPALYAVLGDPVAHSLSPALQEAGFQTAGLSARYVRIRASQPELPTVVSHLKMRGFAGWNCTIPHKENMFDLVDELAPSAIDAQAVNTVLHQQGRLIGYSTDGEGFLRAIREEFQAELKDLRIMILGLGGAGRSLARLCAQQSCKRLALANRTEEKARDLAAQLSTVLPAERVLAVPWNENRIKLELAHIDLLVNTTSVGLQPDQAPVLPATALASHLLVYDTIYRDTPLIQATRPAGARAAHGLSMLLYQGAAAFTIWTGRPAPVSEMKRALWLSAGINL